MRGEACWVDNLLSLVPKGADELRFLFAATRLDGHLVRMFTSNRLGVGQRPVILGYLVAIASVVAAMAVLWLVGKAWQARPAAE